MVEVNLDEFKKTAKENGERYNGKLDQLSNVIIGRIEDYINTVSSEFGLYNRDITIKEINDLNPGKPEWNIMSGEGNTAKADIQVTIEKEEEKHIKVLLKITNDGTALHTSLVKDDIIEGGEDAFDYFDKALGATLAKVYAPNGLKMINTATLGYD